MNRSRQEVQRIIGEAVGEASLQWRPVPTGVFDSDGASALVGRVVAELEPHLKASEDLLLRANDLQSRLNLCRAEAWGIIANAFGGDWEKASAPWREAAGQWRDKWEAGKP